MATIKPSEGFTISQVLNSDGFTLDTTDFADLLDDDEEVDYEKSKIISNQEMLKYLNSEIEEGNNENEEEHVVSFVGILFEELKPRMHSIFGNGKVLKLIKKEGSGNSIPNDARVTVIYAGYFELQDEPFDTTYYHKSKQITLRLGKGEMIPGLQIAISSMKKFEKALFIIQPELAFGKFGCPPRIPANAEVLFSVELVNFVDDGAADTYDELSNEDKKKFSKVEKIVKNLLNSAKENFKMQKIKQAIREYSRATNYLESVLLENDEEEKRMNSIMSQALSNLMICYNKVDKPKLACDSFKRINPTNRDSKAYFHHGKALDTLGEYDEAMKSLNKARHARPNDVIIEKKIREVEVRRRKHLEFLKRFSKSSLRLEENKNDEFEAIAIEMCDNFIKDTLLKEPLPSGLSGEEIECFRRVAARRGLTLTKQTRYDVDTYFLTKKSYYSKDYY